MDKIIIAAIAKNFVIGKNGKMPWHISEEFKHFKRTTMTYPLLMGRKTFFSFGNGKPLKGRLNCILTRDKGLESPYEEVKIFHEVAEVIKYCENKKYEKLFIIGGEQIYRQSLAGCNKMILSFLKKKYDGDTYFPEIDKNSWEVVEIENHEEFDVYYYERKLG